MDWYDNVCFVGDCCFNQCFVDVYGVWVNIYKNDFCVMQYKGIGGGDKGVVWYDYFIVRLDIEQQRCYFQ